MPQTETHTQEQPAAALLPLLLTKPEAAAILRVVPRTLERWARDGELIPVRVGGAVRYRPEDIRALLDRRSA